MNRSRMGGALAVALLASVLPWSCSYPDYSFRDLSVLDGGVLPDSGSTTAGSGGASGGSAGLAFGGGGAAAGQGGVGGTPIVPGGTSGVGGVGGSSGASGAAGVGGSAGAPSTACQSDADCTSSPTGAVCDLTSGDCVECLVGGTDCDDGTYCTDANVCAIGCATDADCVGVAVDGGATDAGGIAARDAGLEAGSIFDAAPGATQCNPATHRCVGCVTDGDCPLGSVCNVAASTCEPGCSATRACPGGFSCCSGDCANVSTSIDHCGACDAPCTYPGATTACVAGSCSFVRCDPGYGDCNDDTADGCEIDLSDDPLNCSGCGQECLARPNAEAACSGGACTVGACLTGFEDCNGLPTDGCETSIAADEGNCGGCGIVCDLANANAVCQAESCNIASCAANYANCDGSAANGCEVDTRTSVTHCGSCSTDCTQIIQGGLAACVGSQCQVVTCEPLRQDCNGLPQDGCEAQIGSDPNNCGGCDNVCSVPNAEPACDVGTCAIGQCLPGFEDCDGDPTNGCEAQLDTSIQHCGSCGALCSSNRGTPTCALGVCSIVCDSGYEDCNLSPGDGCEVNTQTNVLNCGACATPCVATGATPVCVAGQCEISACTVPFGDCDFDGQSCETNTSSDVNNCGGCGIGCTVQSGTPGCGTSACYVAACNAGFDDCDGSYATGCETSLKTNANCGVCGQPCARPNAITSCATGACVIQSCQPPYEDCDGNPANGCEVDLNGSASNCGACGNVCNSTNGSGYCSAGQCQINCIAGYGNCNGNAADGCETTLTNNPNACGICGNACTVPNGTPACIGTTCAIGPCNPGYADCDLQLGNGCETNLNTNVLNCGSCGRTCSSLNGTSTCSAGDCQITCDGGWGNCDGNALNGCETNTGSALANCGGCGQVCNFVNATESCVSGTCTFGACTAGYANCDTNTANGCEVNVLTDTANCGVCGKTCTNAHGSTTCTAGACVPTCGTGYADCNGDPSDGCETDIRTLTDCGACGVACARANASETCATGTCAIDTCTAGFEDCDGIDANGCEVNTNTSKANCGSCGNVCNETNGTGSCSGGTCAISCTAGFGNCNADPADGCEANLTNDATHCGNCTTACTYSNAAGSCFASACQMGACTPGFANCNGQSTDGCETNVYSLANCGGCGVACDLANATESCAAGTCTLGTCDPGFLNCDGDATNGCEEDTTSSNSHCGGCNQPCSSANGVAACVTSACEITCNSGFDDCNSQVSDGCEANLSTAATCGACNVSCTNAHGSTSCVSSACAPTCSSGWGNCDGDPNDGCEADLNTTATDCGACGIACTNDNGSTSCVGGACTPSCGPGFADCDGNPNNGCETSTTTATNCGACGAECTAANGTADCSTGSCVLGCNSGFQDCDSDASNGCEANLNTDVNNCQTCGNVCSAAGGEPYCASGVCGVTNCDPGLGNCDGDPGNGCEADLDSSLTNCGGCGTPCALANAAESCVSGTCTLDSCNTGFGNCDSVSTNGCEINTDTNVDNCGGCGTVCSGTNGTRSCGLGACQITCSAGFGNCNSDVTDGCETNLSTTTSACGACGTACTNPNGSTSCSGGTCVPVCDQDTADCDGDPVNGCEESLLTSGTNCGGCGITCANANGSTSCSNGACAPSCAAGFGDCDGNPNNGCETSLTTASNCGACGLSCTNTHGSTTCTAGACVPTCLVNGSNNYGDCDGNPNNGCETNLDTSLSHCGGCGAICSGANATATCSGAVCSIQCNTGFGDCNSSPTDGCEVSLSSTSNCGSCGTTCTNTHGTTSCVDGSCSPSCAQDFASCDGNANNGCEASTTSLTDCGSCGAGCDLANATESCSTGTCALTGCDSGYGDCDGNDANGCEALTNTTSACGSCTNVCSNAHGSTSCNVDTCAPSCDPPWGNCDGNPSNGCETDTSSATAHCGGCGQACNSTNGFATCSGSTCSIACNTDYGNCDTDPSNGCEVALLTSTSHCGACGNACANANGGTSCVDGACTPTCTSGYASCDGNPDNGCEVDTNTSTSHCDGCGNVCQTVNADSTTCSGGVCEPQCTAGFADCDGNPANGCETNTDTSASHCGGCGVVCAVGECSLGACDFAFPYVPSNFDPSDPGMFPGATAATTTFNCGTTTFNSSNNQWTTPCTGFLPPVPLPIDQNGDLTTDAVVLPFQNVTVAPGSTLKLIGDKPVILAVYGDADIGGTVDANGSGITPGSGGNTSCGASAGGDATGGSCSGGAGGGGGGGHATTGASGGPSGGSPGGGGVVRGNATLIPLLGGCQGGLGGACATNTRGGGGGGVQISVAGSLTVSGTISVRGANGLNGACGCSESGAGGGGSGGAILLEGDSVIQSGSLTAQGGNGGDGSGSGGAPGSGGTSTSSPTAGGSSANGGGGGGGAVGRARVNAVFCDLTGPVNASFTSSCGATCSDGIQNGNEQGVDCGGSCSLACHCVNGVQDADETGIDCGGVDCGGCTPPDTACTYATNGGNAYWFCTNNRNWTTARNNCINVGYQLVTINDATENAFVDANLAANGWIGFNDISTEGTWVWQSGESVTYTNWNTGEPNNSGGEDCAQMYDGGFWNDGNCGDTNDYACEL